MSPDDRSAQIQQEASVCWAMKSIIIPNPSIPFLASYPRIFPYYPELTPRRKPGFLRSLVRARQKQIKTRTDELLEVLGLSEVGDRYLQSFSGGMKRRVNLAIGVMHRPKLFFLDEPTVGVDVQSRHDIIEYLKSQNNPAQHSYILPTRLEEAASTV